MYLTVIRLTPVETAALMILLHLVADYTLQGWLAEAKQRSWWEKQLPNVALSRTKYKYDYLVALICHALYWSLLVCLPFLGCEGFGPAVLMNTLVHAGVDHLKANVKCLNLAQDQIAHLGQIILTLDCLL